MFLLCSFNAPNRREVIEDILDIQIFSQMNTLLKERVKTIKEEQRQCEYELDVAQQKVDMQVRNISNLEKVDANNTSKKQQKFDENESRMFAIKDEIKRLDKECDKLTPQIAELDRAVEKHEKFKEMRTKLKSKFNDTRKQYDFFSTIIRARRVLRRSIKRFVLTSKRNLIRSASLLQTDTPKLQWRSRSSRRQ